VIYHSVLVAQLLAFGTPRSIGVTGPEECDHGDVRRPLSRWVTRPETQVEVVIVETV